MVCFNEATADEQQITDPNIPSLSLRAYIDALILTTLIQFLERYRIVIVRIVLDALLMCIAPVVKQDASTSNPML